MFSDDAIKLLRNLPSEMDEVAPYAAYICDDIGMEKAEFLAHCRKFRDLGYARILMLVDLDDGTPKGSAYARTEKGDVFLTLSLGPGWKDAV
ncbi:hypothetical protein [Thalassospira lohafexi]|uniref:Uncharacterized protein n=1 Tax=Thalassospira lohafexi TaxID=744227 RepID=A0A2N3L473_9PROT|nr:hypothetical protein [Thalassospira lohafexi]PKR57490.1 hypothetical protein COO92_16240 [Thalassospira lohafexi]